MKILLWSPTGAGLHYGGAGTNAYRLYNAGKPADVSVTLVCSNPEQEDYPVFDEIVRLGRPTGWAYWDQAMFLLRAKRWLKENARRFDVFHGVDTYESTIRPAYWSEIFGTPAVVKTASYPTGFAETKGLRRLFRMPQRRRFLASRLSGIIAISTEICSELRSYGLNNIYKIPNGVDSRHFKPAESVKEKLVLRDELGIPADAFVVLFVGSICSRKRPEWIVDGLAQLSDLNPRVLAVFVGPEREDGCLSALREKIHKLMPSNAIVFGHSTNIENFYRVADVYALPSRKEGMPNSVLEAMASGLPCLVTPVSGSNELIEPDVNGFWVEKPEDIGRFVLQYLSSPPTVIKQGGEALRRVQSEYSSKAVLDRYLGLFRQLMGSKRSRRRDDLV